MNYCPVISVQSQTDRRTDRKWRLRAHSVWAQVGSKIEEKKHLCNVSNQQKLRLSKWKIIEITWNFPARISVFCEIYEDMKILCFWELWNLMIMSGPCHTKVRPPDYLLTKGLHQKRVYTSLGSSSPQCKIIFIICFTLGGNCLVEFCNTPCMNLIKKILYKSNQCVNWCALFSGVSLCNWTTTIVRDSTTKELVIYVLEIWDLSVLMTCEI